MSPNNNRIEGGPTKPDVTNMSNAEAACKLKEYKVARKQYTDSVHCEGVKLAQLTAIAVHDE